MYRIIYPNNNTISILIPNDSADDLHEIAKKYVPSGLRYKIIETSNIPSDRTFREAWIYDFNNYDGIGENINHD